MVNLTPEGLKHCYMSKKSGLVWSEGLFLGTIMQIYGNLIYLKKWLIKDDKSYEMFLLLVYLKMKFLNNLVQNLTIQKMQQNG